MVKLPHTMLAASAFALGVFATPIGAQTAGGYVADAGGTVVKNAYGLCWRTSAWAPGMATVECDPNLVPKPVAAAAPPPRVAAPEPPAPPVAAPQPPPPPVALAEPAPPRQRVIEKVTMSTDVFFDFDKAVLKPEGQARLDELVTKLSGASLEVIVASGHTDAVGANAYNLKLSADRADAVKKYLVSKGIDPSRIAAEGKGEANPIADNRTEAGRAKNRRVGLEVIGTREK